MLPGGRAFDFWLLGTFGGALLGSLFAFLFGIARMRIETHQRLCDELCKDIRKAADLATEYWLLAVSSDAPRRSDKDAVERFQRSIILEAQIVGQTDGILGQFEGLSKELPLDQREALQQALSRFLDQASGGEFTSRSGSPDLERAKQVQSGASEIVTLFRSAVLEAASIRFRIFHSLGAA